MQAITTVGFDIAKSVFQVHGVDAWWAGGHPRKLKRRTCWRSSRSCSRAWSDRGLLLGRIIGRANCRRWPTVRPDPPAY